MWEEWIDDQWEVKSKLKQQRRLLSNWHPRYHSKMVTFHSPFSGRKQLLPFLCQWGWLMEVEWSAFYHSKWESVLGNGRNTHLHLSPANQRAVTAPEWMAAYRAWQKNTKCLKVLTCAKMVGRGPVAKRTTTWHLSATPPSGISRQRQLTASKRTTGGLVSFKSMGQVEYKLPLFWLSSRPFVFLSHLPLPSPPSVCLVSPSVRLVSLHTGRQPVSLSSF